MGRIRTVKPELGRHTALYDLEVATKLPIRFAWVMLFTACDREGRFCWRPRELKPECLPHDPIDFGDVLDALHSGGMVRRYVVDGQHYGYIPTWQKHQWVNKREQASSIPAPSSDREIPSPALVDSSACTSQVQCVTSGEGKVEGKESERNDDDRVRARIVAPVRPEPVRPSVVHFDPTAYSPGQLRATIVGLVGAWNNVAAAHPPLIAVAPGATSPNLSRALGNHPDIAWWADVFKAITESDYLMGRDGKNPPITLWKAADKADEIASGKYRKRTETPAADEYRPPLGDHRVSKAKRDAELAAGGGVVSPEEAARMFALVKKAAR